MPLAGSGWPWSPTGSDSMHPLIPQLLAFSDVTFLLLRLLVAVIFLSSGLNHLRDPVGRGASIGMRPGFTRVLGGAEVAGSLGVAVGIFAQLAALGLIAIMLGAIQKKIFVWHTGFWGDRGYGWHYDLMLVVMNLVILTTGGGRLVLY